MVVCCISRKSTSKRIKEYTTYKLIEEKKNNKKYSIRMKARKRKHRTDKTSGKNTVRYKFNSKYTSNSIKLK